MIGYAEQRLLDIRSASLVVLVGLALRVAATGLIAIGVAGVVRAAIGYRFGDSVIAADSSGGRLPAERCAGLLAEYPSKTDCAAAEMAHHADEAVEIPLAAGAIGLVALAALGLLAWRSRAWRSRGRDLDALTVAALAAIFGLAVGVGLVLGADEWRRGADEAPRWFADAGVALLFFCGHLLALRWGWRGGESTG